MATGPSKKPVSSRGDRVIEVKLVLFGKKLNLSDVIINIKLYSVN